MKDNVDSHLDLADQLLLGPSLYGVCASAEDPDRASERVELLIAVSEALRSRSRMLLDQSLNVKKRAKRSRADSLALRGIT